MDDSKESRDSKSRYNLILQRSWEVVGDLDAAGGYEGGAVIMGFREIWAA